MTIDEVVNVFCETHPLNNPCCNGEHCKNPTSKVRIIPLDDSQNVNLCPDCYKAEMDFNTDRELDGLDRILPDLPFDIYPSYLK